MYRVNICCVYFPQLHLEKEVTDRESIQYHLLLSLAPSLPKVQRLKRHFKEKKKNLTCLSYKKEDLSLIPRISTLKTKVSCGGTYLSPDRHRQADLGYLLAASLAFSLSFMPMRQCISFFPDAVVRCPDKSNLQEQRLVGFTVLGCSLHGWKDSGAGAWGSQLHCKHIRKQEDMNVCDRFTFSFLHSPGPQLRKRKNLLRVGLPTSII